MKQTDRPQSNRLSELAGLLLIASAVFVALSLATYRHTDSSWNTESGVLRAENLAGHAGAYLSDILLQCFGLVAFLFPAGLLLAGWQLVRQRPFRAAGFQVTGYLLLISTLSAIASMAPRIRVFGGVISPGGLAGVLLSEELVLWFNYAGALLFCAACLVVSVYLVSSFTLSVLDRFTIMPVRLTGSIAAGWAKWRERRREAMRERRETSRARAAAANGAPVEVETKQRAPRHKPLPPVRTLEREAASLPEPPEEELLPPPIVEEIPIRPLDLEVVASMLPPAPPAAADEAEPEVAYRLPESSLLNEAPGRTPFDEQELQETAARVKSKFEEFHVLGSVVQINPGPVVTTFEFKPEAGIKYSRITTLTEDLCLGLQKESILIERIPGKPTVGIEVPNTKREVISLRQIIESDEFRDSPSRLTISLGKDINGRIRVAALESMPHLLIAGSTGSGKSVMINSMIMSILYKSTPDEVRLIMVDPKRLELGLYEGIPHLLTPVITDAKKATNALKNAVLEMERRLRLLASRGVRNIDQYNRKVRQLALQPRSLFDEDAEEELKPLPYVLILIDELADLMMLEGRNVEESVTRLAQMARAVGMHLVLATQRPSVDVITGIIKANFPARISFRVATRVDSRTVLDVMGAEHLLGKGDMLFLPPGSSRLVRVHGAFVTESEINDVVEFWKGQAAPEYDESLLLAPPGEEGSTEGGDAANGEQDPMYDDALRVVLEMGKASTSTLQRRLRLGYGRAARILDMMYRDGIIGPPDGSKPREVLKPAGWVREVEDQPF